MLAVALAPDLILINGLIHTVDPHDTIASAVAIKGGRFVAIEADDEVRALAGAGTEVEMASASRSSVLTTV